MHIKEELVYDKHSGRLIGFVNLGEIKNHLARFEQSRLNRCLLLWLGVCSPNESSFIHSSHASVSQGNNYFEAVFRLERIGFKVQATSLIIIITLYNTFNLSTTFDGASVNRRLVSLHDTYDNLVYKL